jgi:hypothetical protein
LRFGAEALLPPSTRTPARRTGSQIFSPILIGSPAPVFSRAKQKGRRSVLLENPALALVFETRETLKL